MKQIPLFAAVKLLGDVQCLNLALISGKISEEDAALKQLKLFYPDCDFENMYQVHCELMDAFGYQRDSKLEFWNYLIDLWDAKL